MARVRGKGSVVALDKSVPRNKCRKWQLRVSVGRDLATGEYRTVLKSVSGIQSQANKALRELIRSIEQNEITPSSDMRFDEYVGHWLELRKDTVAMGTWLKNYDHIKCAKMHFGKARLSEITPQVLEKAYKDMKAGKSTSGNPLSGTYISDINKTLHVVFKQAIKEGCLASNPCEFITAPSIDTKEKKALRRDEIVSVIEKLDPTNPIEFAIRLMAKTGIRRGEAHGLSVGDIDRNEMILHIRHTFDNFGNLKEPKTQSGFRDLPLTESALADIDIRLAFMKKAFRETRERLNASAPTIDQDTPLVCNDLGERLLPRESSHWWGDHRDNFDLSEWTLHELRHSYITELARRKVDPKVLQKIAGHMNISTTMDIYTHVDLKDKRDALKVVDW